MAVLRATLAWIWALVIGAPMGAVAGLLGFSWPDAVLVGALGGLGAAIFILFFVETSRRSDRSPH